MRNTSLSTCKSALKTSWLADGRTSCLVHCKRAIHHVAGFFFWCSDGHGGESASSRQSALAVGRCVFDDAVSHSTNEPFSPMRDGGSAFGHSDDLSDDDILFFSQIVDQIDDIWLKARLADLVWLKNRVLGIRFALIAIDAYRSINLDTENWISGGRECWQRALSLARMLRRGAEDRLKEMESTIITSFEAAKIEEGFLSLWLSDLLKEYGLGRGKSNHIAQKLESLAGEFDTLGDLHRAREYYDASLNWFGISGDAAKSAEMTMRVAEGWVKEAIARVSTEQPSHMVAASFSKMPFKSTGPSLAQREPFTEWTSV